MIELAHMLPEYSGQVLDLDARCDNDPGIGQSTSLYPRFNRDVVGMW